MKVIILAGGFGTRLAELTNIIPKPMVPIGGRPIIWHIMSIYAKYGYNDFIVALGYKAEEIKKFFLEYHSMRSNFTVNLNDGTMISHSADAVDWRVSLIDTGENTMTGGRIKRLKDLIGDEPCMVTYGDGVANIDIASLVNFHKSHGKLATMTAVRPVARFGELSFSNSNINQVESFIEKPQMHQGWINGGFFVFEPEFFDLIAGDDVMLERDPLEKVVQIEQLMAYKHDGFWQCMDTKRDHELLEKLWEDGAPWVN